MIYTLGQPVHLFIHTKNTHIAHKISHYPYILDCIINSSTFLYWAARKSDGFLIRSRQLGKTAAHASFLLLRSRVLLQKPYKRTLRRSFHEHLIWADFPNSPQNSSGKWLKTAISQSPLFWSATFNNRLLLLTTNPHNSPTDTSSLQPGFPYSFSYSNSTIEPSWNSWNQSCPKQTSQVRGTFTQFPPMSQSSPGKELHF